jgi:Xaa-Pro dipeptidase
MRPTAAPTPKALPAQEIERRLRAVRRRAAEGGFGAVLAYADCWRTANVRYFTDFRPLDGVLDIALALLLLPTAGEPVLLVGDGCLEYARSVSHFRVESFAALASVLSRQAASAAGGPVGLAGARQIPAWLKDAVVEALDTVPLVPTTLLAEEKARKSAWELTQMREAARITDLAMAEIRDALEIEGPASERDIARLADEAMIAAGADGPAYLSMVQSGPRSAFSLALPTDRVLRRGELVMTDIGARFGNYVADGGRGFAFGPVSDRQRDIIETAADAVEAGLRIARPGITASALNGAMQRVLIDRGFAPYSGEAKGRAPVTARGWIPRRNCPGSAPAAPRRWSRTWCSRSRPPSTCRMPGDCARNGSCG